MKPDSQAQVQSALAPVESTQPGKVVRGERMWRGEVGFASIRVVKSAKMERVKVCMMDIT